MHATTVCSESKVKGGGLRGLGKWVPEGSFLIRGNPLIHKVP